MPATVLGICFKAASAASLEALSEAFSIVSESSVFVLFTTFDFDCDSSTLVALDS